MEKLIYTENTENLSERWGEIHDMLVENSKVEVVFTKVDGSERIMFCTLAPEKLPAIPLKENVETHEPNYSALRVWDVEKKAWRSFRTNNVRSIKVINEVL